MGLSGNIIDEISYRAQIELSNEGKFEVLDMYASIKPVKNLSVSLGQMQIPIYNSYQTAPAQMLFANRTFMAKYLFPEQETLVFLPSMILKSAVFRQRLTREHSTHH